MARPGSPLLHRTGEGEMGLGGVHGCCMVEYSVPECYLASQLAETTGLPMGSPSTSASSVLPLIQLTSLQRLGVKCLHLIQSAEGRAS